jgi:hypothetical protein
MRRPATTNPEGRGSLPHQSRDRQQRERPLPEDLRKRSVNDALDRRLSLHRLDSRSRGTNICASPCTVVLGNVIGLVMRGTIWCCTCRKWVTTAHTHTSRKRTDDNAQHTHRHAHHAWEDFSRLRRQRGDEDLWHSLSHHLRHTVWRTSLEVPKRQRRYARRRSC